MFGWLRGRGGGGAAGTADAASSAPPAVSNDDTSASARPGRSAAAAPAAPAAPTAAAPAAAASPPCSSSCCYSRPRGGLYDRYFAWLMGRMGGAHESKLEPLKRRLFLQLVREALTASKAGAKQQQQKQLTVLEVGMGLGPNCARLAEALREHGADPASSSCCKLVGIEPNLAMHDGARGAAAAAGFASTSYSSSFDLRPLYAEQLADAFPPASFDAAVVTLVFCSVPDVQKALAALRHVIKPGGRLLLLEHVAHPDANSRLAQAQRLLDPLWSIIGDGCSLSRDTRAALREAGILQNADNEARLADVPANEGGSGMGGLLPLVAGVLVM